MAEDAAEQHLQQRSRRARAPDHGGVAGRQGRRCIAHGDLDRVHDYTIVASLSLSLYDVINILYCCTQTPKKQ